MTRSDDRRTRRGYHHGNLREALIQAAQQLMAERGPEGVTLSEAARMAGVSPAAPYRHFKDRTNLVAARSRSKGSPVLPIRSKAPGTMARVGR